MTVNTRKFTPEDLIELLGDIRADHIAGEVNGTPFIPVRHPLYLEYAFELLRQLLPEAAMEKSYANGALNRADDVADHQVCNRAVRMMIQLVDRAFYERFKPLHPKMPKQLTDREWGTYMLQLRFHGWHNGVPVYPSLESGVDAALPLDFITEERDAMARIAQIPDGELIDRDPFDIANAIKGGYPNTSLAALVLVATKVQSLKKVQRVVETARTPSPTYTFPGTVALTEQIVDSAVIQLGWTLSHGERESAVQALHLAPALAKAA